MEWTPDKRLELIEKLAQIEFDSPQGRWCHDTLSRIIFLCSSSSDFLEVNKENYNDVIEALQKSE